MTEVLGEEEIRRRLAGSAWQRAGETIVLEHRLPDFAAAVEYVQRVGELAEAANHHPDILIHGYNRVRLTLSTHSAGGLTGADFALAQQIDGL
jgi:4a-hydroxytetrahydrobiopterin dehydratase